MKHYNRLPKKQEASRDQASCSFSGDRWGRPNFGNAPKRVPIQAEANDSLVLQRILASMPTEERVLQRVTDKATDYRSGAQIKVLSLDAFEAYAQVQADWFASDTLEDADRDKLRTVLAFGREDNIIAACGGFTVEDMMALSAENLDLLRTFSATLVSGDPIKFSRPSRPFTGIRRAEALPVLEDAFGAGKLKKTMKEGAFDLITGALLPGLTNYAADVIRYYKNASQKPFFEATDGSDFNSYVAMRDVDHKDPMAYEATSIKGRVRNYHRFEKAALNGLVANFNDKSKTKPLTLILHSGTDHNGAFHRAKGMTKVITNGHILALMVEGHPELYLYSGAIKYLAGAYGMGGKIDQALISGHGGMRSVEMATTEDTSKPLDLDGTTKHGTKVFLDWIVEFMDPGIGMQHVEANERRRIVFNACLTNTNEIPLGKIPDSTEELAVINKAIRDYLAAHPTISAHTQTLATKKGIDATVEGANAVTRASGLIDDDTGRLGLSSDDDTHLVADKLEYVEKGKEPIGVFRAAVECLISETPLRVETALLKMTERAQSVPDNWREAFIVAGFTLVLRQPAEKQAWLLTFLSKQSGNVESQFRYPGNVTNLSQLLLLQANGVPFFERFKATALWDYATFKINMLQGWMSIEPEKAELRTEFLAALEEFDCSHLQSMIKINFLKGKALMENLLGGDFSPGKLRLALLGVLAEVGENHSRDFLLALLHDRSTFAAGLNVQTVLGSTSTVAQIQVLVGQPIPDLEDIVEEKEGNVKLTGDLVNKAWVRSITRKGKVTKVLGATLYSKPANDQNLDTVLALDSEWNVFGEMVGWYAIENAADVEVTRTGYIYYADLNGEGDDATDTTKSDEETEFYNTAEDLANFDNPLMISADTEVTVLGKVDEDVHVSFRMQTRRFSSAFVKQTDMALQ